MTYNHDQMEQLFAQFVDGDEEALFEFIELQRHTIFDYVLRMTGQSDRAISTVDDLMRTALGAAQRVDSGSALRLKLFAAARRFHVDAWGVETSHLLNLALEESDDRPGQVTELREIENKDTYLHLDKVIRHLEARDRELIWLTGIADFNVSQISQILGVSQTDLEHDVQEAWHRLSEQSERDIEELKIFFETYPLHPIPGGSDGDTMAISQMISELTQSKRLRRRQQIKKILIIAVIIAAGVWFMRDSGGFAPLLELIKTKS